MIESYLLEHLVVFSEHRTLSETASVLHLTQPTLTRSMNKLEETFGVPLFTREKKRIRLNENGWMAVRYAKEILREEEKMIAQVKALDRRRRTITVGSCAPGPMMELVPFLTDAFTGMTVSTEIKPEKELLAGLADHTYQFVILNHPSDDAAHYSEPCGSEHLCACLPPSHKRAYDTSIRFDELNGENFLMMKNVGVWSPIVRGKMPNSKFRMQDDQESFREVVEHSLLPSFSTDISLRVVGNYGDRLSVPFSDPEAQMNFYCVCLAGDETKYKTWFEILRRKMG